jgi:two-component system chemotaxis response regulator CheB
MPARTNRDLVVVGASAGGVQALRSLVGALPADLPAAVLVVLHLPAGGVSSLPAILSRASVLPVSVARPGAAIEHGHVYVAPPDHHLVVHDDEVMLSSAPAEDHHRPALNALFRSAAEAGGQRVIGVVLSGTLDDGAAGLAEIVARGGAALVQDPAEALYSSMPEAALAAVTAEAVLPTVELAKYVVELLARHVVG